MPVHLSEGVFTEVLKGKLGDSFDRALALFRNGGDNLSFDITNTLMHAADKGKIPVVLDLIEEHYKEHLQFQHPEIRGMVSISGDPQMNPTKFLFTKICTETLGLQPAQI